VVAALGDARGGVGTVAWPRKLAGTWLDGGGHGARRRSEKGVAGGPAREARATSLYSRRRASSGPMGGRQWYLGPRGRATPAEPLVAARWYGDAGREAPSACARAWGRGGLEAWILGRRKEGRGRQGDGARRGGRTRERILGSILLGVPLFKRVKLQKFVQKCSKR
jgi:hypothetical protein